MKQKETLSESIVSWKRKELSTMKISESAVALSSSRHYSRYQETRVESVTMSASKWNELQQSLRNQPAEVSISEKSQSLLEKLKEEQKSKHSDKNKQQPKLQQAKEVETAVPEVQSEEDQMLKTLRRILEMLKQMRKGTPFRNLSLLSSVESLMEEDRHFSSNVQRSGQTFSMSQQVSVLDLRSSAVSLSSGGGVAPSGGTTWIRHTEKSGFMMEQESVSFSGTGLVKAADGREISFDVDLEMSRGFAGSFFGMSDEEVILTDPLVINLETGSASVTNQSFFFDLDADGKEEEISSLGQGSGFLAYDRNGDGMINDGSELFGTKSGDGFADLAKYDEDGNGWIDENDQIFKKLKVWTKNSDGVDQLVDMKKADVGAIYLGSANTQYHLNDSVNRTNAVIQKTGVFLKESGTVGTIQHVDLAV